jgi:hypothetical protein
MPGIQYQRDDFIVRIDESKIRYPGDLSFPTPPYLSRSSVPLDAARAVLSGIDVPWPPAMPSYYGRDDVLQRVCLIIDGERLAELPLEEAAADILRQARPGALRLPFIVRLEATPPRVAQVPMTLPLRLLQLDLRGDFNLPNVMARLFANFGVSLPPEAVQCTTGASLALARWTMPPGWKTVDVLHVDSLLPINERDLFRLSAPDHVGSLGWFLRCTDLWNTRLVVIRTSPFDEAMTRRLAQRITARGGPAVLVIDPWASVQAIDTFYNKLIHDGPIDVALALAQDNGRPIGALFAGSGREELMRVSAPTMGLPELVERVRQWAYDPLAVPSRGSDPLGSIIDESRSWRFDVHEGDGMVPLARALGTLRSMAAGMPVAPAIRPLAMAPRYANLGLWGFDPIRGRASSIPSPGARLRLNAPVVLGVQIGSPDGFVPVLDAVAFLEEPFKWEDGKEGVWLSVGVTGLDFTVSGAPLQEVWLPRTGASDLVEFVVAPTRKGISQVRICIYYGADLLMSQRLAAHVVDPIDGPAPVLPALAEALDVAPERVGNAGWLARVEYTTATDLAHPPERPDVALSIFANSLGDRRIFTLKSKEGYEVTVNGYTPLLSNQVRAAIDGVSRDANGIYAFPAKDGLKLHEAAPAQRDAALQTLALVGWRLFQSIFSVEAHDAMADDIAGEKKVIQVGHSLLENVIPWALLYDRQYDAARNKDPEGRPVLRAVCPAGLPAADGEFVSSTCGTHADCPLSAQGRAAALARGQGVVENTIVCARHFWGLRHIIELPPYQEGGAKEAAEAAEAAAKAHGGGGKPAEGGSTKAAPRRAETQAHTPAAMLRAYNDTLVLAPQHLLQLDTLQNGQSIKAAWVASDDDRDDFLQRLKTVDADFVYLYCHARGGLADPTVVTPTIELSHGAPGPIEAGDMARGIKLRHHPLVFLNGCDTAKFSPDALSPFILTLVRDCEAAGVLGTEIPVFELLAGTVAMDFLGHFLNGEPAGMALLTVRRALMAGGNPLGLAYTLYAVSELKMRQ